MICKSERELTNILNKYKQDLTNGKILRDIAFENKIMDKIENYKNYSNVMSEYERRKEEILNGKNTK